MIISPELAAAYGLNPEYECYDNSTLATIDSCVRKAYWKLLFTLPNAAHQGVQERVGIAAHFGTSIHAAMDKFYSPILYKTFSFEKRKIAAFREFSLKYAKLIPDHDMVEEPYTHPTGVSLLDSYFSHYQEEDNLYQPLDTEICAIVLVKDLDPPFYWISRLDGNLKRLVMRDILVREFKTTKSSLANKLLELKNSRQVEGYVWSIRQPEFQSISGEPIEITGVMADILAVRVKTHEPEKLFLRDVIHVTSMDAAIWHRETIIKVKRWRDIQANAAREMSLNPNPLIQHHYFDRMTNECLRYGKCSYYDLCVEGLSNVDLQRFLPNDWNPLHAEKMEEVA